MSELDPDTDPDRGSETNAHPEDEGEGEHERETESDGHSDADGGRSPVDEAADGETAPTADDGDATGTGDVDAGVSPVEGDRERTVWLRADDAVGGWERRKRRITAGLEAGVDWVLVDRRDVERVRELGAVNVAAFDGGDVHVMEAEAEDPGGADPDLAVAGKGSEGDGTVDLPPELAGSADLAALRRGEVGGAYVRMLGEEYQTFAREAAHDADVTLVVGEDWTVIPTENLIADVGDRTGLVAGVTSAEEAAGSADRVCVDTGTLMNDDEGMLVGSMSRGLLFVHAETADSPYVDPRPFRVNAGAVHAYVRTPGGETRYLAELESGDEVLVADTDGETRTAVVGRVKIERRPMFRVAVDVDAAVEGEDENDRVETLVQNAETIKVAADEGRTAVTDLEPGDRVRLLYEPTGRHFGTAVEERIVEK
ncbi:3-dehydroquinate synthase II [Halobacteriales archaeon SW_7_71_33]|nr:MAG: 3-dehydroquinate synthase II [Halobacteriales archaeon SW_7_71_33]